MYFLRYVYPDFKSGDMYFLRYVYPDFKYNNQAISNRNSLHLLNYVQNGWK